MTLTHLVFALALTAYILVAIRYEERDLITVHPDRVRSLDDYLRILHEWTERIQSSPGANAVPQ